MDPIKLCFLSFAFIQTALGQGCSDISTSCAALITASPTFCASAYGMDQCQLSCSACPTPPPGDPCQDNDPACSTTFAPQCNTSTVIQALCQKTCKKCVPDDGYSCFDTGTPSNCALYKSIGLCGSDPGTMKRQCMLTCDLCPPPPTTQPPPPKYPITNGRVCCANGCGECSNMNCYQCEQYCVLGLQVSRCIRPM